MCLTVAFWMLICVPSPRATHQIATNQLNTRYFPPALKPSEPTRVQIRRAPPRPSTLQRNERVARGDHLRTQLCGGIWQASAGTETSRRLKTFFGRVFPSAGLVPVVQPPDPLRANVAPIPRIERCEGRDYSNTRRDHLNWCRLLLALIATRHIIILREVDTNAAPSVK